MRSHYPLYVCLSAAACGLLPVIAAEIPSVLVRIYNSADVPESELKGAIAEAAWQLARAGVDTTWVRCELVPHRSPGDPCREERNPAAVSLGVTRAIPVEAKAHALAFSILGANGQRHAAILYPRICELARQHVSVVRQDQVLGNVFAHEIVHLILGSAGHDTSGLLRANWERADFRAMGQRRLHLNVARASLLPRKLSLRNSDEGLGTERSWRDTGW